MPPPRPVILGITLLLVAAAAMWVWRLSAADPMAGFRDFPWTYITVSAIGSDESRVVISRGSVSGPTSIRIEGSGETAWPAFFHPDPSVVPQIGGKPCIFPVISDGPHAHTPVIPALKRPLTEAELAGAQRFLTPEGEARMAAFRTEMGQ